MLRHRFCPRYGFVLGYGSSWVPGLATSVYAASEGLSVLVLDCRSSGGQAGASARIENYLGFPTGISGMALMARAYNQAHKFGVETTIPSEVVGFDTPDANKPVSCCGSRAATWCRRVRSPRTPRRPKSPAAISETGQFFSASSAIRAKVASSRLGTCARNVRAERLMRRCLTRR